jgi:hypothetical protein
MQVVVIVICLAFLGFVFKMIASERLMLKYSLLWIFITVIILVCAIFPEPVFGLAKLLGFGVASNFIFLIAVFCLIAICLSLCAIVSKQSKKIKNLIQDQALLESRLRVLESNSPSVADAVLSQDDAKN